MHAASQIFLPDKIVICRRDVVSSQARAVSKRGDCLFSCRIYTRYCHLTDAHRLWTLLAARFAHGSFADGATEHEPSRREQVMTATLWERRKFFRIPTSGTALLRHGV